MWAPCVVRNPADGLYWMFYAGVTRNPVTGWHEERIGAATSSDLVTWTRVTAGGCAGISGPGCLMDADWDWYAWDEPNYWAAPAAIRSSSTIRPPAPGTWSTATAPGPFALDRWSSGWRGPPTSSTGRTCGPLAFTDGTKAESPILLRQGGTLHLVWTLGDDGGIGHARPRASRAATGRAPTRHRRLAAPACRWRPRCWTWATGSMLGYVMETLRDLRFRIAAVPRRRHARRTAHRAARLSLGGRRERVPRRGRSRPTGSTTTATAWSTSRPAPARTRTATSSARPAARSARAWPRTATTPTRRSTRARSRSAATVATTIATAWSTTRHSAARAGAAR